MHRVKLPNLAGAQGDDRVLEYLVGDGAEKVWRRGEQVAVWL